MNNSKQQQLILDNLRIPIKSFRIFALEEIIKSGGNPEILSALKEIQATEDDQDCSILISNAIEAVSSRLNGDKNVKTINVDDNSDFLGKWEEADDRLRMHIISNMPSVMPQEFRLLGPKLVEGSSPIVTSRIIRLFGRYWPEDKYNIITNYLHSDNLVLKLASLRTLVHLKPDLLLNDLPQLLFSEDPEIKALAIRALVKIDKEEALKHLQALLLSPTKTERLAGIQNCPFLPFETVKPLLLKYFAAETNQELLVKAGWIIEMNPDVEVPFALFEIVERSPANKAELVKKVLNESVKLLNKSGILGDKFSLYTQKLQNWVVKRNALRFVRQIIAKLDGESIAPEIEQKIVVTIKQPIVREAFSEAINWPISGLVKQRIKEYLGINNTEIKSSQETKEHIKKEKQEKADNTIVKYQDFSLLEMLETITPEEVKEKFDEILLLLTNQQSNSELKVAVFQCLTRCKLRGAEDIAISLISSHDISVATAAVEYLGIVNPDCIIPYLGQCLKIPDIGMKSAALGILKNSDYNQAISSLRAMLYSSENNQQKMALECISQFDFVLVRDILTDFLCLNYPEPLLEAGLCHFAANPSSDNIYYLYKIERSHTGIIAEQARSLREACPEPVEKIAETLDEITKIKNNSNVKAKSQNNKPTKKTNEAELKERLRIEKEKKHSNRPAYAYRSSVEVQENTPNQNKIIIAVSVIALLIIISSVYSFFFNKKVPQEKPKSKVVTYEPVKSEPIEIEGEVVRFENAIIAIKATNKETYILAPLKDGWKVPEHGRLIRGIVVPYRRNSKGEIDAHFGDSGYDYISEYTEEFIEDK